MNTKLLQEYRALRAQGWPAKHSLDVARYNVKYRASRFYNVHDREEVTFQGAKFKVHVERDEDHGKPWDDSEPLGEVRQHRYSAAWGGKGDLAPGFVWLSEPDGRSYGYSYDRAGALCNVRSWGETYRGALGDHIVEQEESRFGGWLRDQWEYVGVGVTLGDQHDMIWGIESDCPEYIADTLENMARELLQRRRDEKQRAMLARCFC